MRRALWRRLHALVVWAGLAGFGIAIGVLALARSLERNGAGGRWRRAHTTGAEIDALLERSEENGELEE